ncbi:RadC family protein [Candidatus Sneabacter namystus]|uniref:DNA repair protein RadC n=1 Tax=Candidatus Sneabacter namystus TaxID=2601646 RepID=A0A5C0UH41_9RICK|nr:DNA repair protein RadC [Candidatus Sneabacter namystus]QEK39455.1 DNA repair protein RadC [Candidatus Sneabacter namystus]
MSKKINNKNHYTGHRGRLKARFLQAPSSTQDYEILELLLFSSIPRKDTKPIAKELLTKFDTLANIIYADKDKLLSVAQVSKNTVANIILVREILNRVLQQNIIKKDILCSWSDVIEYLQTTTGHMKTEQFRIIFLNKKNEILSDEVQSVGTVDQTSVYPREVVKRALFFEASAILLAHNHPSGDPRPSKADIVLTQEIVKACDTFGITVHDHVIIGKKKFFSFKSDNIL